MAREGILSLTVPGKGCDLHMFSVDALGEGCGPLGRIQGWSYR